MTDREIGIWATLCWLLFPAIAVPVGLIARRRGFPAILQRFVPWLVVVPVVLVSAYAGSVPFALLLTACAFGAAIELDRLSRAGAPSSASRLTSFVTAAAALAPAAWWWTMGQLPSHRATTLIVAAAVVAVWAARRHARWPLPLSALAVGVLLMSWLRLELAPYGFRFVLVVFSVVAMADVLAFAIGRLLGGPKPFPTLSPGKTLSGYGAAIVSAVLVVYLLWFALPELTWARRTELGIVLAVSGALGDLGASLVKRRHGVKDFGTLLGPQGGLLDRLDSLLVGGWIGWLWLDATGSGR